MDVSKYQTNTQKIFLCVSIYFDIYKNTIQAKQFLPLLIMMKRGYIVPASKD
jgi:hypothetical protein